MIPEKKSSSKWFGQCTICGRPDQQLATTKTSTGRGLNYTTLRACEDCRSILHQLIEETLEKLGRPG